MFIRVYLINISREFCKLRRSSQFNVSLPEFSWENEVNFRENWVAHRTHSALSPSRSQTLLWFGVHNHSLSLSCSRVVYTN